MDRCGAYAEHWKELGMSEDWQGCELQKGHEGPHGTSTSIASLSEFENVKLFCRVISKGEVI